MHIQINDATTLVTSAIEKKGAEDTGKTAYKKAKEIRNKLLSLSSAPDQATQSALEQLLHLEQHLPEVAGDYRAKLLHCFGTLTDRKAVWIAHTYLTPNCKTIMCGKEPLLIPMHTLDLLKTHSTYIKENEKQELHLPNIAKTTLQQIIDHLSSGCIPPLDADGLVDFYCVADFLGISSLQIQSEEALSARLSQQSWTELLHTLCKVAIGKIKGKVLPEVALRAFIVQESRYAHNIDYLPQPDANDYIENYFCLQRNLSMDDFRRQARENHPDFVLFLEAVERESSNHDVSTVQHLGHEVYIVRCRGSVTECLEEDSHEDYITASLYLLDDGASDYDERLRTEKQLAILSPCEAKFELLRDNPKGWLQKMLHSFKQATTTQEYEKIIDEALLFKVKHDHECLDSLKKACNVVQLGAYYFLKRIPEAKKLAPQLTKADCEGIEKLIMALLVCQYESGIFKETARAYYQLNTQYQGIFDSQLTSIAPYSVFSAIANGQTLQTTRFSFLNIEWNISGEDPIGSLVAICEQNPERAFPRIVLAHYYWKNNQDQHCLECCTAVLRLQKNPEMLFLRASLFLKQKMYAVAEKDCLELLKLSFVQKYLLLYVRCLDEAYGFKKALDYLNQRQPLQISNDLYIDFLVAKSYQEQGETEKVAEVILSIQGKFDPEIHDRAFMDEVNDWVKQNNLNIAQKRAKK